jgi:hypothetical protein
VRAVSTLWRRRWPSYMRSLRLLKVWVVVTGSFWPRLAGAQEAGTRQYLFHHTPMVPMAPSGSA